MANKGPEVLNQMSPTMKRALVAFSCGEDLHGRELSSLAHRKLIEPNYRCLTRLGQTTADFLIQEAAK